MTNFNRKNTLQFDANAVSKVKIGIIQDVYVYLGYPCADVLDSYGNLYTECSVLGVGGDRNNWSHPPLRRGMEVVVLPTGYNSKAIILGTIFTPRDLSSDKRGLELRDLQTINNQDHLAQSNQDYIIAVGESNSNGNVIDTNYLQITPKNGVIMETTNNVRIQLPEDGILRISSNRQIIDEPLNGQQFINVITPFFQSLASINQSQGDALTIFNTALQSVNEILVTLGSGPQAAVPVTNAQLAGYFLTLSTALAGAITDLAASNAEYGTIEYQFPTDELKPKMEATINRKVKLPK
jgi:hypothetical protein